MSKQNNEQPRNRSALIRSALLAMLSLLLTVAVAASLTFALFVNEIEENHVRIQAGDLAIQATLTDVDGWMIDTDPTSATYGSLIQFSEEPNTDLTEVTDPIFLITNAVPTQYQTATILIENGGNISFDCTIRISEPKDAGTGADSTAKFNALKGQILITMQLEGNEPMVFLLSEYDATNNEIHVGNMKPGATQTLTITALFLNDAQANDDPDDKNALAAGANELAMGGAIQFDFTLIATQTTAAQSRKAQ